MQISVMVSEIRRALGRPSEVELDDNDILMEIWGVTTFYRTRLNLTGEAWSIGRWTMTVPAGAKEMNISPGDISCIFMVKTSSNQIGHIPRQVNLVKPDQMPAYWSGPDNLQIGGGYGMPHMAAAFCPINEGGQWKMLWAPEHLSSADYIVWYTTSGAGEVPPIFEDFSRFPIQDQHFYLIADCSLNLFGQIADPEKGLNERQKLLMSTQEKKIKQWEPVFEAAMWDGFRRETPERRRLFGESRDSRIGGGWF